MKSGACAAIRFCLNAKELGSTIRCQPDLKICKLLKWILLQSLFRQVLASAHLIKWSKPSQVILFLFLCYFFTLFNLYNKKEHPHET